MIQEDHMVDTRLARGILLDDPSIPKEIVDRVTQKMLELPMSEHIGATLYERSATRTLDEYCVVLGPQVLDRPC